MDKVISGTYLPLFSRKQTLDGRIPIEGLGVDLMRYIGDVIKPGKAKVDRKVSMKSPERGTECQAVGRTSGGSGRALGIFPTS